MLRNKYSFNYSLLILISALLLSFCSSPVESESNNSSVDILAKQLESISPSDLSPEEVDGLLFMREEEKLARDLYLVMFEKWEMKIFNNISKSEQKHMDAVKALLDRYQLDDPIENDITGEFMNDDLQTLYNNLVDKGNISILEALKAGAIVEETDILDLEQNINAVDNEDIKLIYGNLLNGSKNHLRAFVRNIEALGEIYTPTVLSEDNYNEIITSTNQKGNKNKQKRWGRRDIK